MLTLEAPAKINWFLHVRGRRSDGFHEIESLLHKITLFDRITFAPSDDLELNRTCDIPPGENLVYKAAQRLNETCGGARGARMFLEKNIPAGAGLGGGSSDAAAALLGLNELWALGLSRDELSDIAEGIGSDVPFFLHGSLSYAHGRGEKLVPRRADRALNLLLVKPLFDVSTAWVYKNFSMLTKKGEKVNNIEHFIRNIERAELSGFTGDVSNDLESVTVNSFPVIAEIKDRMIREGALFSLMSGSGPAVFGVFSSKRMAENASHCFAGHWTAVVETMTD